MAKRVLARLDEAAESGSGGAPRKATGGGRAAGRRGSERRSAAGRTKLSRLHR